MNMAKSAKNHAERTTNKIMSLDKAKAGQIVFSRILIIIITDLIVAALFNFVREEAMRHYTFHMQLQKPLVIAFAALLLLTVVYLAITLLKKIDTSAHYMTPLMIVAVALYLLVSTIFFDQFATTPFLFYTMTIIVSVLFAVYYIYTILLYKK